jgi:AcrR family transcriptional regulator
MGRVTEATTRRLLHRDERQAQILRAAAVAFARGGYGATSMEDVAAEAGITRLIVYRHFDSKEDLYRSVLTAVTDRLREQWQLGLRDADRGFVFRTLLTVAREQPDGYRLLFEYAAREPQFRTFAEEVRAIQVELADQMLGQSIPDPIFRRWATRTVVGYLTDSVLAWLEVGDPGRDDEFVEQATDALLAIYLSWADVTEVPGPARR